MRRDEKAVNKARAIQFLSEMTFGVLGTVGENSWPNQKPVNYVYHNDSICFHGSLKGEKVEDLGRSDRASFLVAREYAIVPSTFMQADIACPATSYFKSVYVQGRLRLVHDVEEKAVILSVFMEKLQPEGGYRPITVQDKEYLKQINGTNVFRLEVERMTAKFNFAQNLAESKCRHLVESLRERASHSDLETIDLIEAFRSTARPTQGPK